MEHTEENRNNREKPVRQLGVRLKQQDEEALEVLHTTLKTTNDSAIVQQLLRAAKDKSADELRNFLFSITPKNSTAENSIINDESLKFSATIVAQNQRLIEQNNKIISLLEMISQKS